MLNSRDAFKVGVLHHFAKLGMTPDQMLAAVKQASAAVEKVAITGLLSTLAGKTIDTGRWAADTALGYGLPLAIAGPPIIGGAAGYGLSRATDIDDTDVDEIKDREVLDELKRNTQHLQRQRAVRDYMKQRQRTGQMF